MPWGLIIMAALSALGYAGAETYKTHKQVGLAKETMSMEQQRFNKLFGQQDIAAGKMFGLQKEQLDFQKSLANRQLGLQERQAASEADLMRMQIAKQPDAFQQQIMAMAAAIAGQQGGGQAFRNAMIGG